MQGKLNLQNINLQDEYEANLNKYNGTTVKVLCECDNNTYEIETYDGSEYTIFKNELEEI